MDGWYGTRRQVVLTWNSSRVARAIRITVIRSNRGLPETPQLSIKPRPPGTMPTPFLFFDSATLVQKDNFDWRRGVTKR